jgi:hypothetical protein
VQLQSLPLTPNGKLDRKALPAPGLDAYATRGYEAPQGEIETVLAGIWQEVLKLDRIGRHDNFFELGGHSLLAMRTISRLHARLGVSVELSVLFEYPKLAPFTRRVLIALTAQKLDPDEFQNFIPARRGLSDEF